MLIRAGLDAEALTAAGVDASSIGGLVGDVTDHMAANPDSIAFADAAYFVARRAEDNLKRLVRSGLGSPEDTAAYQAAAKDLEATKAAREAAMMQYFNAAVAGLSTAQRDALATIRANRSWRLPPAYLAANRTQQEWVDLGDALTCERIAAEQGKTLDSGSAQLLSTCRSESGVADALFNVDTEHASVQTAWNVAVAE